MTKKERYERLINYFKETMPVAETELNYGNPYELLVAVMLSAQCTDKRVNMVTPNLFKRFPSPNTLAEAKVEEVLPYVRSVSYPNNKAKHLVGMARMLLAEYGGEVPSTGEELERLPGVGRKTANVIQAVIFQKSCMPVDTHVFRLSHRIGLVSERCTTPLSVEKELIKNLPAEIVSTAHHWLILHGRYVCTARNPHCNTCGLLDFCARKFAQDGKKH